MSQPTPCRINGILPVLPLCARATLCLWSMAGISASETLMGLAAIHAHAPGDPG